MDLNDVALQSSTLDQLDGIKHAFFTRQGGVSSDIYQSMNIGLGSDDDRARVEENRARCAKFLNTEPEKLATPYQVHSPDVVTIKEIWSDEDRPKCDGVVTDQPGVMLGIATADCGPVLFADGEARVIGAAHAGWRGATGGVLENTISSMEKLGAHRTNIVAVLGPTIAQTSYEVGPEFVERLQEISDQHEKYFIPSTKAGHAMFDLPAYILDRLTEQGLKTAIALNRDTYAEENLFYSYRRTTHRGEPDYGRLLSAIVLD